MVEGFLASAGFPARKRLLNAFVRILPSQLLLPPWGHGDVESQTNWAGEVWGA